MKPIKVTVLGCGPAGLIAAQAASLRDCEVRILSVKNKSMIVGAQYLHEPIRGIDADSHSAEQLFLGTREVYAQKVYGRPDAPCSWDRYHNHNRILIWSLHEVYEKLWEKFSDSIVDCRVDRPMVQGMIGSKKPNEIIVSSIPLPVIVPNGTYSFQEVVIDHWLNSSHPSTNRIVWNGLEETQDYRISRIFGHNSMEYSADADLPPLGRDTTRVKIKKPISSQRTAAELPEILRVGRYGKWMKDELLHDVQDDVDDAIGWMEQRAL